MPPLNITLEGTGVRLIPMEAAHAAELFAISRDPQIWAYLPVNVTEQAEMDRIVASAITARESSAESPFVIVDTRTGNLIGTTRYLDISWENRHLEIGWTWLTPSVWRTAVNTECKYLLLKHAFETLGVIRVQIKTDARNLRSQQAIERIGGVREGVLRKHRILWDGYIRDSVYYSILKEEWPEVKERFEARLRETTPPAA